MSKDYEEEFAEAGLVVDRLNGPVAGDGDHPIVDYRLLRCSPGYWGFDQWPLFCNLLSKAWQETTLTFHHLQETLPGEKPLEIQGLIWHRLLAGRHFFEVSGIDLKATSSLANFQRFHLLPREVFSCVFLFQRLFGWQNLETLGPP